MYLVRVQDSFAAQFSFVVRVRQSLSEVRARADIGSDITFRALKRQDLRCLLRSDRFLGAANHHRIFGVT